MSIFNIFKHKNDTGVEPEVDLAEKLYTLCYKCDKEDHFKFGCYNIYTDELINITCDDIYYINIYTNQANIFLLRFCMESDCFWGLSGCKKEILDIIYNAINEREEKYKIMCIESIKQKQLEAQKVCKHLRENGVTQ